MIKYLDELRALNLPKGKFSIFGSGPLAIRNIRENQDIDILVTNELWDDLAKKYPVTQKTSKPDSIYIGNIQILKINYMDWRPLIEDPATLITNAEIIDNFPFVKLEHLIKCKKLMGGEKHLNDITLIQNYIESHK